MVLARSLGESLRLANSGAGKPARVAGKPAHIAGKPARGAGKPARVAGVIAVGPGGRQARPSRAKSPRRRNRLRNAARAELRNRLAATGISRPPLAALRPRPGDPPAPVVRKRPAPRPAPGLPRLAAGERQTKKQKLEVTGRPRPPGVLEDLGTSAEGEAVSAEDLGTSAEGREEHLRRHDGGRPDCPRCRYYKFGPVWRLRYPSLSPILGADRAIAVPWLEERPARLGGAWGLGCAMCAAFTQRIAGETASGLPGLITREFRHAKWSHFAVRPRSLTSSHVRQHTYQTCHKIAVAAYFRPDEPIERLAVPGHDDGALLAVAVPQPEDWLRAWRAALTPQSFCSRQAMDATETYASSSSTPAARPRLTRIVLPKLIEIMADVIRADKRRLIAAADTITISLDDKAAYRLIRFKADDVSNLPGANGAAAGAGEAARGAGEAARGTGEAAKSPRTLTTLTAPHSGACAGILAVLTPSLGKDTTVEDADDDYSRKVAQTIYEAIREVCTPRASLRRGFTGTFSPASPHFPGRRGFLDAEGRRVSAPVLPQLACGRPRLRARNSNRVPAPDPTRGGLRRTVGAAPGPGPVAPGPGQPVTKGEHIDWLFAPRIFHISNDRQTIL